MILKFIEKYLKNLSEVKKSYEEIFEGLFENIINLKLCLMVLKNFADKFFDENAKKLSIELQDELLAFKFYLTKISRLTLNHEFRLAKFSNLLDEVKYYKTDRKDFVEKHYNFFSQNQETLHKFLFMFNKEITLYLQKAFAELYFEPNEKLEIKNKKDFDIWYTSVFRKFNIALNIIKEVNKKNKFLERYIKDYKQKFYNEIKVKNIMSELETLAKYQNNMHQLNMLNQYILDEINNNKLHINYINEGAILIMNAYNKDGVLIKKARIPFTKEDINYLRENEIEEIYFRDYGKTDSIGPEDYTIMVIEDEITVQELIKVFLDKHSFDYIFANNGLSALKKIKNTIPDLILLDINMPEMDGLTFLKKLSGQYDIAKIPIIMLTSLKKEEFIRESISLGAVEYVSKPIYMKHLKEKIFKLLKLDYKENIGYIK